MHRSVIFGMGIVLLLVVVVGSTASSPFRQHQPIPSAIIFDPDPNHLWNRTYACLFIRQIAEDREYGADALDPLLWWQTRYLLSGESHRRALRCLDEFLDAHAERLVGDPLEHAILQRDLWAVFDWAASGNDFNFPQERHELEVRLAAAIYRLAITAQQANALPDTYAAAVASRKFVIAYDPHDPREPFLPPELFEPGGPWVCLSAQLDEPTAIVHFSGRSRFLVFLRLPGERADTLANVDKLRSSHQPPLIAGDLNLLNLDLPQFPAGTEVALVRQAIVIDNEGHLVPTKLTERVQLRVYHAVTPGTKYMNTIGGPSSHDQDFFELRMRRPKLFAHRNGGFSAIKPANAEFATFSTQGTDAFESAHPPGGQGPILGRCAGCHGDSGIHSVQSRLQWMKSTETSVMRSTPVDPIAWETQVTIARKQRQPDFTLLVTFMGLPDTKRP